MLKKLKLAAVLAAVAGSAFAIAPAQATPVITNWNFTVDSGFSAYTPNPDANVHGTDFNSSSTIVNGLPAELFWGCGSDVNCSSWLNLGGNNGDFSGSLVTGAAPVNTVTITDHNFVVQANSLTSATILDVLTLTPELPLPVGSTVNVPPLTFNITYNETPNQAPCVAPSGNNPCADILVLSTVSGAGAFLNTNDPNNVFLSQNLNVGGNNYLINLFIDGLGDLTNAECEAANAPDGCIGLITQEQNDDTFNVRLQIVQAPEPISVSLFGAGLIGAGALRLRRKAKKA